jgi:hypothetical protein
METADNSIDHGFTTGKIAQVSSEKEWKVLLELALVRGKKSDHTIAKQSWTRTWR